MATPGASLRFKRLRQRFGISAPRMAIRTHVAWYWRAITMVIVLSVSLMLAFWGIEFLKRLTGTSIEDSVREVQLLRGRVLDLEEELNRLRRLAGSAESNVQIERAAQQQLSKQVKTLESENAVLRQDLAFFEGMMQSTETAGDAGLRVDQIRLVPDGEPGKYRYRMLVISGGGKAAKEQKVSLQLAVRMQLEGKDAMISLPSEREKNLHNFNFEIKHFQRIEGVFAVPEGAVVKSVEVRLLQEGAVRAKQSVTL